MSSVPRPFLRDNLRAVADLLAIYPSKTVQQAFDQLGIAPLGLSDSLLDLQGPKACEAIERKIRALSWQGAA